MFQVQIEFHVLETILTNRNPDTLNNQNSYKSLKYKQTLTNKEELRAHIMFY